MLLIRSKTLQEASKTLPRASKARKTKENLWFFNVFRFGPNRFQAGFKTLHDASKPLQHAPRRPQDAPRRPPRRPKTSQDAPKTPQDAPKTPQDAPRRPKDTPKTPPRRPKMLPRRSEKPPRYFLVAPGSPTRLHLQNVRKTNGLSTLSVSDQLVFNGVLRGSKRHVFECVRGLVFVRPPSDALKTS